MTISEGQRDSSAAADWQAAALAAVVSPGAQTACPACGAQTLSASWNLTDLMTGEAAIELRCAACRRDRTLRVALPPDAAAFYPLERVAKFVEVCRQQLPAVADQVRRCAGVMPAAAFTTDPRWEKAGWSATTFRWHPTSEAPPVMGIVFDHAEAGRELFADRVAKRRNGGRLEDLRVSIVEGAFPGEPPGYTVHLHPDPEGLAARATAEGFVLNPRIVPFLGRWNRGYPLPGSPPLLGRFKEEYEKHKEFLLAPVTRRGDGQLWVDVELGAVQNTIRLRDLSDIKPDDADAGALAVPYLIAQKPVP